LCDNQIGYGLTSNRRWLFSLALIKRHNLVSAITPAETLILEI